jgi:hypothetical protein
MYDPISVDTALVSANGDLLISLTDGNIVNAGKVRGAQGIQGERGYIGERGEPGRDGVDGAKWHTGVGMPEVDLGKAGDLYMDVASALIPIYQKVNNDWLLLCNLKSSSGGGVSGGNGVGGGGGNIIIENGPNGPITDGDGVPVNDGDLWYDPLNGWLHVYHQGQWLVVAGDPPVLMSAMPPDQDYGEHPIQEGSLWFDTEQLALYVAGKDSLGAMRWITAIPSDRSAVDDTVNIPFVPPGIASTGTEATNPVTGIVYVYNATKKQWIDKAPKMGGAYYQEDAPDPNVENLRPGDLWINSNTHNLNVWTGDTWAQVNPGCNSNPKVHFQPSAPNGTQHIRGDLWIDSDTNKLFTWNGDVWMEVGANCGGPGTEEFVKIVGDTMTGPLILHDEDGNQAEINIASQAAHKAYVDDQDAKLQQEIVNLEEEINNIQTSVEGGRWNFTINPSVTAGEFRMSGGTFTQQSQTITIHRTDLKPADHYWSQSEVGHYLEILDQTIGSTNNALYLITAITKDTGAAETVFEAELVRGTGAPSNNQPCVIKTFELQGADPTAYVRKVGDVMTGPLRLQDNNGNPSTIYLDDQAVHKQYVDETVFGLDRECIELNGGKLCGGEPMPRFYNVPNWTYKQKTAAGVVHNKSVSKWWDAQQKWIYHQNTKIGNNYNIKIYISKTSLLDDQWDLLLDKSTIGSVPDRVKMSFRGVGKKYLYISQDFNWSSANGNSLSGYLYAVRPDGQIVQLLRKNSLAGFEFNSYKNDADGNFGAVIKQTTYDSGSANQQQYIYMFNEETENTTYHKPADIVSGTVNAGFEPPFVPQGVVRGFYVVFSNQLYNAWHSNNTTHVKYYDPDSSYWTGRTDVKDKLAPALSYFLFSSNGNYSSSYGIKLTIGDGSGAMPYTYILYNKDLERFYCIAQYSDTGRYTRDGSMGFEVYRSKEYKHEDINWKTFDWNTLFTFSNGAEKVLDSPNSYARELKYFAGEIVTNTYSGVLAGSGTAGEPIIRHPYGKVWGSTDKGETWDSRETELRNEDGTLIANVSPYMYYPENNAAPVPDGGDYLNIQFRILHNDTNEQFYNEEGKITEYIGFDDELITGAQRYDLPFNIYTGQQTLFWNGVQIQPPLSDGGEENLMPLIAPLVVSNQLIYSVYNTSSITDGNMYTFANNTVASGNWNQVFLTPKFIKDNASIPDDATEIVVNDMTGTWTNTSSETRNRTSSKGTKLTVNGIDGVLVNMIPTGTSVSSSYRTYHLNIPNAVSYLGPFEQSGIIPLD